MALIVYGTEAMLPKIKKEIHAYDRVFMETVLIVKSQPNEKQSERSDLPQDYSAI